MTFSIIFSRKSENISRSKSINDIGLPPIERSTDSSLKKKVNDSLNFNGVSNLSNTTNSKERVDNAYLSDDDNHNRPSVSEIRKKFDGRIRHCTTSPLPSDALTVSRLSDNRFKKQDVAVEASREGDPKKITVGI